MEPSTKANMGRPGMSLTIGTNQTTRRRGRKLAALAAAASTVAMLAAPTMAGADPRRTTTSTYYGINCMELVGPAGTAQLAVDDEAASTARYAPGADPNGFDPPELVSSSAAYVLEGDTVTGTFELADFETGEPAGHASFEAHMVPTGDVSTTTARGRQGNIIVHETWTTQPLRVSGTLRFSDGAEYSLDACTGERRQLDLTHNMPHAFTERLHPQTTALCQMTDEDGYTVVLRLEGHDTLDSADVELFEPNADEYSLSGSGEVTGTTSAVTGEVPLADRAGEPAGSAAIAGDIATSAPTHSRYEIDGVRYRLETRELTLSGTITVPGRPTFSLDGCTGVAQRGALLITDPNRPQSAGVRP